MQITYSKYCRKM